MEKTPQTPSVEGSIRHNGARLRTASAATFLGLFISGLAHAQTAYTLDGNVFFRDAQGVTRQITSSGKDYSPSLGRHGTRLTFARAIRSHPDLSGLGTVIAESQLFIVDVTAPAVAPVTVLDKPVEARSLRFQWFDSPRLSPDGASLYFLVPDYGAVAGLFSLDLATKRVRFVLTALKFWLVPAGPEAGNLIVWQNPMLIGGGRYDVFNMVNPSGTLIGVVGFSEEMVHNYLFDNSE